MTLRMPAGPLGEARDIPVGGPEAGGQPGGAMVPPEMQLSGNGAYMPGLGAIPKQLAFQIASTVLNGGDVTKATEAVYNMKRQRLGQLATGCARRAVVGSGGQSSLERGASHRAGASIALRAEWLRAQGRFPAVADQSRNAAARRATRRWARACG
jgi:hypothetical protein